MTVIDKISKEQQNLFVWLEIVGGVELQIDNYGNYLSTISALGSPPIENIVHQNGFRSGVQFVGQRHNERYIPMRLGRKDCGCFGVCGDALSPYMSDCVCSGGTVNAMRYLYEFFKLRCDEFGDPKPAKLWFQHKHNDQRRFNYVYPSQLPGFVRDRTRPVLGYDTEIELLAPSPYFYEEEVCDELSLIIGFDDPTETATSTLEVCSEFPMHPCFEIRFTNVIPSSTASLTIENTDTGASFSIDPNDFFAVSPVGADYTLTICPFDAGTNRFITSITAFDHVTDQFAPTESLLTMINSITPPNALQSFVFADNLNWRMTFTGLPNERATVNICANPTFGTI